MSEDLLDVTHYRSKRCHESQQRLVSPSAEATGPDDGPRDRRPLEMIPRRTGHGKSDRAPNRARRYRADAICILSEPEERLT